MIRLKKQGKLKQFDITNYEEKNRLLIMDLNGATQDSNGRLILKNDPTGLYGIIVTDGFANATQKLRDFETSPLVPTAVIEKLKLLDDITAKNSSILFDLLKEKVQQDDGYFLEHDTTDSKYQKALDNLFALRSKPLQPAAAAIIETIRQYLGTG
jgi:hypothetical protein